MSKLIGGLGGLAMLALATVTPFDGTPPSRAVAADKQLICHVSGEAGAHIIDVSKGAVSPHLVDHGDCFIDSTDRELIGEPCDPTDVNGRDICDVQP